MYAGLCWTLDLRVLTLSSLEHVMWRKSSTVLNSLWVAVERKEKRKSCRSLVKQKDTSRLFIHSRLFTTLLSLWLSIFIDDIHFGRLSAVRRPGPKKMKLEQTMRPFIYSYRHIDWNNCIRRLLLLFPFEIFISFIQLCARVCINGSGIVISHTFLTFRLIDCVSQVFVHIWPWRWYFHSR